MEASCHCGAVRLNVAGPPVEVTDCNCSICRCYGVLWAYYSPRLVEITGDTDVYVRPDGSLEFHRCAACGCVTHWSASDPSRDRMGVNARLFTPEVLAAAKVRHLDGAETWAYLD